MDQCIQLTDGFDDLFSHCNDRLPNCINTTQHRVWGIKIQSELRKHILGIILLKCIQICFC